MGNAGSPKCQGSPDVAPPGGIAEVIPSPLDSSDWCGYFCCGCKDYANVGCGAACGCSDFVDGYCVIELHRHRCTGAGAATGAGSWIMEDGVTTPSTGGFCGPCLQGWTYHDRTHSEQSYIEYGVTNGHQLACYHLTWYIARCKSWGRMGPVYWADCENDLNDMEQNVIYGEWDAYHIVDQSYLDLYSATLAPGDVAGIGGMMDLTVGGFDSTPFWQDPEWYTIPAGTDCRDSFFFCGPCENPDQISPHWTLERTTAYSTNQLVDPQAAEDATQTNFDPAEYYYWQCKDMPLPILADSPLEVPDNEVQYSEVVVKNWQRWVDTSSFNLEVFTRKTNMEFNDYEMIEMFLVPVWPEDPQNDPAFCLDNLADRVDFSWTGEPDLADSMFGDEDLMERQTYAHPNGNTVTDYVDRTTSPYTVNEALGYAHFNVSLIPMNPFMTQQPEVLCWEVCVRVTAVNPVESTTYVYVYGGDRFGGPKVLIKVPLPDDGDDDDDEDVDGPKGKGGKKGDKKGEKSKKASPPPPSFAKSIDTALAVATAPVVFGGAIGILAVTVMIRRRQQKLMESEQDTPEVESVVNL